MTNIKKLTKVVTDFRDKRGWRQYNSAKAMSIALLVEAAELLDLFKWNKGNNIPEGKRKEFEEELIDVLYWLLLLANDFNVDLEKVLKKKMRRNEQKYPVKKYKNIRSDQVKIDKH